MHYIPSEPIKAYIYIYLYIFVGFSYITELAYTNILIYVFVWSLISGVLFIFTVVVRLG